MQNGRPATRNNVGPNMLRPFAWALNHSLFSLRLQGISENIVITIITIIIIFIITITIKIFITVTIITIILVFIIIIIKNAKQTKFDDYIVTFDDFIKSYVV